MKCTSLYPCFWLKDQLTEAASFYEGIFPNSSRLSQNPYVVQTSLDGCKLMLLGGNEQSKPNATASLFITCDSKEEVDFYYHRLMDGGTIMMELGKYDWSEWYAWVTDRFGISWQIYLGKLDDVGMRVVPCFLYVNNRFGTAEKHIDRLQTLFSDFKSHGLLKYPDAMEGIGGKVMHAQFQINDQVVMAMDGPGEHHFEFNEAFSLVVECDDQLQIDHFWDGLIGEIGHPSKCGWLTDAFGISWQIVPKELGIWMSDPQTGPQVAQRLFQQSKIIINELLA